MKLLLLALLPLVLASPVERERRALLDGLQGVAVQIAEKLLNGLGLSIPQLKSIVSDLALKLESDETEGGCEAECVPIVDQVLAGDPQDQIHRIVHSGCPIICTSFQELAHALNVNVLHITTPAPSQ